MGLPVLSWLYHVDLTGFLQEFIVLIVGGGIYALASFLIIPLTSARYQRCIAWFLVSCLFAWG